MQKTPSLTLPRKREREFFQKYGGMCMFLKVNCYDTQKIHPITPPITVEKKVGFLYGIRSLTGAALALVNILGIVQGSHVRIWAAPVGMLALCLTGTPTKT